MKIKVHAGSLIGAAMLLAVGALSGSAPTAPAGGLRAGERVAGWYSNIPGYHPMWRVGGMRRGRVIA